MKDIYSEIEELEERLNALPKGTLVYKTINGQKQPYLQQTINGKSQSAYIKTAGREKVLEDIKVRDKIKEKLSNLKSQVNYKSKNVDHKFKTNVKIGSSLDNFVKDVKNLKKRDCFVELEKYLYGNTSSKVFILYGLRRTGKTTLIRQAIANMNNEQREKSVFMQISSKDNLASVNFDLKYLESKGFKYVFIDEVTLMEDFVEGAALFSDLFATCGIKIVLSGTDSLGFMFAEDEQLYDRCIMLHTTFISYKEFERVLGINSVDEYIRFGGTMSVGGVNYNQPQIFANEKTTNEYVDSAIAKNIQHSLKCYQYEGHFRNLEDLYRKNELTSAINRVVEDINHNFTIEVLTKDFVSNDLGISSRNLRSDIKNGNDILDKIDKQQFVNRLKEMLEIKNKDERLVEIQDCHRTEIKEYLSLLDLIVDIDVVNITNSNNNKQRTVFTQPGMRFAQAEAFVKSLLMDDQFNNISAIDKDYVLHRILSEIKGRMLEDIVLLETKFAKPNCQVFKLQFATGEFDMVVVDPQNITCEIYEIKHSAEIVPEQYRHLIDTKKSKETEFKFGKITNKYVIYRGENITLDNGITYLNVEDYLRKL